MTRRVTLTLNLPSHCSGFRLPAVVQQRLETLLDRQDQDRGLNCKEVEEAAGLVDLAELLALINLQAARYQRHD